MMKPEHHVLDLMLISHTLDEFSVASVGLLMLENRTKCALTVYFAVVRTRDAAIKIFGTDYDHG